MSGISIMVLLAAAQASGPGYGPPLTQAPAPQVETTKAEDSCRDYTPTENDREIVICAQKPQGYRLNPDTMEARRAARQQRQKPPESQPGGIAPGLCANIGGCTGMESIDWVSTAIVLGKMAVKAAKGENVGKMFVTRPEASEYELYLEAKHQREALEAQAALAGKVKAMKAEDVKAETARDAPDATP